MRSGFYIALICGSLLLIGGHSARAADDSFVFWDRDIARSLDRSLTANGVCQPSPYALYRQTCVSNPLNVTTERDPFQNLTYLDHIAIFVNKYRNLNTSQQLIPGIKFKVNLNLTNMYQQQAKLEARLGVRW
jgi:hypothetical protein